MHKCRSYAGYSTLASGSIPVSCFFLSTFYEYRMVTGLAVCPVPMRLFFALFQCIAFRTIFTILDKIRHFGQKYNMRTT